MLSFERWEVPLEGGSSLRGGIVVAVEVGQIIDMLGCGMVVECTLWSAVGGSPEISTVLRGGPCSRLIPEHRRALLCDDHYPHPCDPPVLRRAGARRSLSGSVCGLAKY